MDKLFLKSYSAQSPHLQVRWVSYHIPKTAGSSLRLSFESALTSKAVSGVYAHNGAKQLTLGRPLKLPKHCQLVHGHFRPRDEHLQMFPNAKTIVWLRDPVERICSLVRHLLQEKGNHPQYLILKDMYLEKGVMSIEEIVVDLIINKTLPAHTSFYTNFFKKKSISSFDFVGSVHRYEEDIKNLGQMMNFDLDYKYLNVRGKGDNLISRVILEELRTHLKHEYDIVKDYL